MRNLLFFLLVCGLCGCRVSHVFLRANQLEAGNGAIRIYMDRYGDFYPAVGVPMVAEDFNQHTAGLRKYFLGQRAAMGALKKFYGVAEGRSGRRSFRQAQDSIISGFVRGIQAKLASGSDGKIVLIIHGFNDPAPEQEYLRLREMIDSSYYVGKAKPVYVEIYWDGLMAGQTDEEKIAAIWQPAVFNSRWVGLSLRRIVDPLQAPVVVVTHSLGAGVATGMLFNNKSKFWPNLFLAHRLKKLMRVPTPTETMRLGMLAPAIPGILTFKDFDKQVPEHTKNPVEKIVVGYNERDYAVTKTIDGINFSPLYGSTTFGCNYFDPVKQRREFDLVRDMLQKKMGYTPGELSRLWVPMEFKTAFRPDSVLRQHIMPYYLSATPTIGAFLDDLFKN